MTTIELDVDEANAIQDAWMKLDSNDSEDTKRKVFADMKKYPRAYFSLSSDGKLATAIVNGTPCNAPMDASECRKHYGHLCTSKLAWQCDKWIVL